MVTTVFTVLFMALCALLSAALPSPLTYIEPGEAVAYYTSAYAYRIYASDSTLINEARIIVPPGVSAVTGISSGIAGATAVLTGSEIVVSYPSGWNTLSDPNFDVIYFNADPDAGDKYFGSYFNGNIDAAGVTANGYSQFVTVSTITPTFTFSPTITATQTVKDTPAGTLTITETLTSSPTITMTSSKTQTPNWTATPSYTGTPPTSTATPTVTRTATGTATPSSTATPTYTVTDTATITCTPTFTATPTITNTITIKGIDASVFDNSGSTCAGGEMSAPLTMAGFTNIGGADVAVTAARFYLRNSYGTALNMSDVFSALYLLDAASNTIASSAAPAASFVDFSFTPLQNVPLQNTSYYYLFADVKNTTFTAAFAAGFESPADITCAVPVAALNPFTFPEYPVPVNLQRRTTLLEASYYDLMPPAVSTGQKNLYALMLTLSNPGNTGFSDALLTGLTITVKDASGAAQAADTALEKVSVSDGTYTYFSSQLIPGTSSMYCAFASPVTVQAVSGKDIYLVVDVKSLTAGAAANFSISVDSGAMFLVKEYHTGLPVACNAKAGYTFPMASSAALIQWKAQEIGTEYTDLMPASVSTGQNDVEVMKIIFTNKGTTMNASAMITRVNFYAADAGGAFTGALQCLRALKVCEKPGGLVYGSSASLSGSKISVNFTSNLVVAATSSVTVSVMADIASAYSAAPFKILLNSADDVSAVDANIYQQLTITSQTAFPKSSSAAVMQAPASYADFSAFSPLLPAALLKGQADVPVFSFAAGNSNGLSSAPVSFAGVTLTVMNSFGAAIAANTALTGFVLVDSTGATVASAASGLNDRIYLNISPPQIIFQGVSMTYTVYTSIPITASAPDFSASVISAQYFNASDYNSGILCLKNILPAMPWDTAAASIFSNPATDLLAGGDGTIAPVLATKGQPAVRFMLFDFYNPGAAGTADVSLKGVTITVLDSAGTVIAPSSALSAVSFVDKQTLASCGSISLASYTSAAPFYLALSGAPFLVPESNTKSAYITGDIAVNASASNFRLRVASEQDFAAASNPSGAITRGVIPGNTYPVDSNITTISSFVLALGISHENLMPISAAKGDAGIKALKVIFVNNNSVPVSVTSVAIAVKDASGALLSAASAASNFYLQDGAGNTTASAAAGASANVLLLPAGFSVPSNSSAFLTIVFDLPAGAGMPFYAEITGAASIGTLPITVINPVAGEFFGNIKSSVISIQEPDFASSAHGFPNPFNPASGSARIEYYLAAASRVTIRVFSVSGRPVAEIAGNADKQAGLHSEDTWNGNNASGRTVKSGVYLVTIETTGIISGAKARAVKKLVVLK